MTPPARARTASRRAADPPPHIGPQHAGPALVLSMIVAGVGWMCFAYIGFDAVSTAAQEARRPQRDLPVGILASLAICTVLYIAVALVLIGIVPCREPDVADPLAVGIDRTGLAWLSPVARG